MTGPDVPGGPRRGRRPKDQKRIPLSLRVTPRMRESLGRVAESNGRSLTQQTEFLLEQALLMALTKAAWDAGPAEEREAVQLIHRAPPSDELIARFVRLEGEITGLRAAVEKGLDRNAEVIARLEARLDRRVAEFEAKLATDATELTTAIGHLQTATAHLLAALKKVEALSDDGRHRRKTAPRPRLVASNDKDAG
jgi:hypothetical protein